MGQYNYLLIVGHNNDASNLAQHVDKGSGEETGVGVGIWHWFYQVP